MNIDKTKFDNINKKITEEIFINIKNKSEERNYLFHNTCSKIGHSCIVGIIMNKTLYLKELFKKKNSINKILEILKDIASYSVLAINYIRLTYNNEEEEELDKLDVFAISESILGLWLDHFGKSKKYIEHISLRFLQNGYVMYYKDIAVFSIMNGCLLINAVGHFDNDDLNLFFNKLSSNDYTYVIESIDNLINNLGVTYAGIYESI